MKNNDLMHFSMWDKKHSFFGDKYFSRKTIDDYKFKQNFMKWIESIKVVWPDAPFYFREELDPKKKGRKGNKVYKDGLFLYVESVNQLHVKPHWQKKLDFPLFGKRLMHDMWLEAAA